MNHIRTQAAGNIIGLITKGDKVFINEKSYDYPQTHLLSKPS